jgi:uncharacterized MAPEG superfamily protein
MTTPLLCILAAYLLIFFPKLIVLVAQARMPGGYDNKHPRDQQARLEGWGRRAMAAHMNAFEAFAPFAAAALVSHVGHGDPSIATTLAIAFVLLRVAYTFAYLANTSTLRTSIWVLGMLCVCALFLLPLFPARG